MKEESNGASVSAAGPADPSPAEVAPDERRRGDGQFPIVGIGASAGGLEAFRRLLGALPSDTGMAYVLVQHLDRNHDSILAELLSGATKMEVSEVQDGVRVEPNHVYVIPPTKDLALTDGHLKLVPRTSPGAAHMPIDCFLKTLADVRGSRAIGVVLSGMGSDGTLGLQAIEAEGGIAFAQDPESATYQDMPRSAIAAGSVDFVLTPEAIALELGRLGRHPYLVAGPDAGTWKGATTDERDERADREGLAAILRSLHESSGTDFRAYKKTTLRRRIARRMTVTHIETFEEYARHLEGNEAEAKALYDDCLISVTSFFRDPEAFAALSERILPLLIKDRPSDSPIRVWVPGCATGEEAYSIAICLLERMAELSQNVPLQIFATDLNEAALAKAREGTYLVNIARDVSAERLRRFFSKTGDHFRIGRSIREMCVFARHDLTSDPPYSRLDLISCRNVLIYLEPRLQEMVFATFHYALRPGGHLLVGPAETVGASAALFSPADEKLRIYVRNPASGPLPLLAASRDNPKRAGSSPSSRKQSSVSEAPREVDRVLLARFGPAGVLVDEKLRVLEFRGDTDPFLDHGHGKASLNLEHLLRKGLLMDLRQAIEETRRTDGTTRRTGLQVRYRQELRSVAIEVIPIKGRAAGERCLLVLFEAEGAPEHANAPVLVPPADMNDARDREIERLTQGLTQATEYMHSLVREHEAALEELQSTTEEALSSNEELQSLNEEMQTAKEEIQSANEELATLNHELQDRNVQLARSNDDIQRGLDGANAMVDTVPEPLVILDGDLRVEKANIAFYEKFETTTELTRGQPFQKLGSGQWNHPALLTALDGVFTSGKSLEELELEVELPGVGSRTLVLNARRLPPERGGRGRVLLAIADRTELRRAERGREHLFALEQEARKRAEAADQLKDEFVATASHELRGPLTVISGWMNVLQKTTDPPDAATLAKALAAIGRGVAAQGRLVSDLLDYSRIVAGKTELQRAPMDLQVVAEAALVGVRAAAQAKDIDVQLAPGDAPHVVLGDFDRMQQVLWNVFLNAVKFTPPGGAVRIRISRVGTQMHLTVRDTGCGISEDFLPLVFERFRQAEGSSTRSHPGLGLGLTLVRELVELHGGTVRAESAGKDRGATFTIVLPIPALLLPAPPPDAAEGDSEEVPSTRSTQPPPSINFSYNVLDGTRVLVVDDEPDARDALVSLLERHGARVISVANVADAMASFASDPPDVLVSDIGMPGADGYELIRRVRGLPVDQGGAVPSLAVSAYATDEHRKKVATTGFQLHLEKPVTASELVTAVARLAGRSANA